MLQPVACVILANVFVPLAIFGEAYTTDDVTKYRGVPVTRFSDGMVRASLASSVAQPCSQHPLNAARTSAAPVDATARHNKEQPTPAKHKEQQLYQQGWLDFQQFLCPA